MSAGETQAPGGSAAALRRSLEPPALEVDFRHRFGRGGDGFELDVRFAAPAGVTALFGRSGAGKTSVAQAVAGLLRPREGRIAASGRTLFDSALRADLPPHRRRVGYVFQEGRLFPHLSVRANLRFARRFSTSASGADQFDRVVALLGIEALLARRPAALSGGEKQRVAIGRALLSNPAILLMDEPLAALDQARKSEILPYLERLRDEAGTPVLYVSHSLEEVSRLATTIVALDAGRVARVGPAAELLSDPGAFPLFGRREAGSILEATVSAEPPRDGLTRLETAGGSLFVAQTGLAARERLRVRIRAQDVMLARERPGGVSARSILAARIAEIGAEPEPQSAIAEVSLTLGDGARDERLLARVTRQALRELGLRQGDRCFAVLKSVSVGRRDIIRE